MALKQRLTQQLLKARQMGERMLADFKTPQQWTHQVQPGVNHALWFAGHMAVSDNFFVSVLDPAQVKDLGESQRLFGVGSQPVDDPAHYPPPEAVLEQMRERRQTLLGILETLSDEDLAKKTPPGSPNFLADLGSVFEMAIWHEGVHTGQLSIARRAIGCEPLMT
jgi:hypothetical protein